MARPKKWRDEEEKVEERSLPPPPEERCSRNDGKKWRCRAWKLPDSSLCLVHYEQARMRATRVANGKSGKGKGRGSPSEIRVAEGQEEGGFSLAGERDAVAKRRQLDRRGIHLRIRKPNKPPVVDRDADEV
ncbi:unnamed protein product [Spirodela intermedia]|uniref:WRC domain-containing protein n=1 Tax=Spirodela intermedia TaxID=51605 RepID=A0A7I8L1E7_SPIIN|nr:unnamed protein product [Spirodela intermedia]